MSGSPSSPDPAVVQLELKRIVTSSLSNTKKGKALVELLAGEQALDAQGVSRITKLCFAPFAINLNSKYFVKV